MCNYNNWQHSNIFDYVVKIRIGIALPNPFSKTSSDLKIGRYFLKEEIDSAKTGKINGGIWHC